MRKLTLLLLFSVTMIAACKEDTVKTTGITGEWEWVKTYGGIAGQTTTPQSTGISMHLEITGNKYREFRNDSLIFEYNYELETRPDTFFGANTYILFDSGYELAYIQNGDDLKLIEICFDCFEYSYERR